MRLTALLHDLMKEGGKMEADQLLWVTHKTLTAALDSGVLTLGCLTLWKRRCCRGSSNRWRMSRRG